SLVRETVTKERPRSVVNRLSEAALHHSFHVQALGSDQVKPLHEGLTQFVNEVLSRIGKTLVRSIQPLTRLAAILTAALLMGERPLAANEPALRHAKMPRIVDRLAIR